MGKDLNGKEIGEGLSQRKDGRYTARYVNSDKKRIEKYFKNVHEAKKWLADYKYEDTHNMIIHNQMTLDEWYKSWIKYKEGHCRENTIRQKNENYNNQIKDKMGDMLLTDIKPIHCQMLINAMADKDYATSYIGNIRTLLGSIFRYAVENDLMEKNPITKSVIIPEGKDKKIRFLTIDEQNEFLEHIEGYTKENQFRLILQTGLRTSEMIGLKWSDIDFEKRELHVNRILYYRHAFKEWKEGSPKTKAGIRTIPLTDEAIRILKDQKEKKRKSKVENILFKDLIFTNEEGKPLKNNTYDNCIYKMCDQYGMEYFSMHSLRHTFATRCIEGGMNPKTLQKILGHSKVETTLNTYVHATEEFKREEIDKVQNAINGVKLVSTF